MEITEYIILKICEKFTVLLATSIDLAGTSVSSETVRRMHDDNVALSNKCVLPAK